MAFPSRQSVAGSAFLAERYRLLVNAVQDYAIFMLSSTGHIETWNPGAEKIKGYKASDIIGRHFSTFYTEKDVASGKPDYELRIAAQDGRFEEEGWRVRKDGSLFFANVVISALRDENGVVLGFAKVTRDLTERENATRRLIKEQIALAESEAARKRSAFLADLSMALAESVEIGPTLQRIARMTIPMLGDYCVVDLRAEDGTVQQLAVAHVDPEKEPMVARLRSLQLPEKYEAHPVPRVLRTGISDLVEVITDEMLVAGAANNPAHLDLLRQLHPTSHMVVPMKTGNNVIGSISFVSTREDRHFTTIDLGLAEDLAQRAALVVENNRLYERERRAVQLRDDFVSIASHELKTPLTSLHLHVESLLRNIERGITLTPERHLHKLQAIAEQVDRQERLVADLLDFSRIAAGRLEFRPEHLDLREVATAVAERFEEELAKASCTLSLHMPDPVMGKWDRLRIDQILTNLLSNAIKYAPGKPIDLRVETKRELASMTLVDRGIGIPTEDHERIFERFERAVSQRNYGGFGLGLWIVREIVSRLGGTISVASEPGKGAAFMVQLPLEFETS